MKGLKMGIMRPEEWEAAKQLSKQLTHSDKESWVFAVHKWETIDGSHHVHWHIPGEDTHTENFGLWSKALQFARKKTKELGLKEYQVDSPRRPNFMVSVKEIKKLKGT